MIWKCRVMQVKFIKVWCNRNNQSTNKPGSLVSKRERALVSTEWLSYNLAHPTPYPGYKEKLPALKDADLQKLLRKERFSFNVYQLTRNISDKKILKKVSVKILQTLHSDRLIFPLSANRKNLKKKLVFHNCSCC